MLSRSLSSLAVILAALSYPTSVAACDGTDDQEKECANPLDVPLDMVFSVGQRRDTLLEKEPSSVRLFGQDELIRINADHPSEILNRTAGVFIHRGSGQEHLTAIRSPVLTGGAGAGSFLYLQNGVPIRSAGFANINGLLEAHSEYAERIEVHRGPSGAAYGANAIHGVINVLTPKPDLSAGGQNASFSISGDTIGRIKSIATFDHVNGNQGFALGLSVLDDPGFRADSGVDQQKFSATHVWRGEDATVTTSISAVNINQETAGFVLGDDAYLDAMLRRTNPNPEAFRDVRSVRASSRVDLGLSESLSLSITPFARWTDMDFLLHFLPSRALEEKQPLEHRRTIDRLLRQRPSVHYIGA